MKDIVQNYLHIDVRLWRRQSLLETGNFFTCNWLCNGKDIFKASVLVEKGFLALSLRHQRGTLVRSIPLEQTPCNFGGYRHWFRCPMNGCGKRIAILYVDDSKFACRECCKLSYENLLQEAHDRLATKVHKLREHLNWPRSFSNGSGRKTKSMHWRKLEQFSTKA